jgi:hypothetical protein
LSLLFGEEDVVCEWSFCGRMKLMGDGWIWMMFVIVVNEEEG